MTKPKTTHFDTLSLHAGARPDPATIAAMGKYNESLQKAGVLLALDGLHPPSVGARVSF